MRTNREKVLDALGFLLLIVAVLVTVAGCSSSPPDTCYTQLRQACVIEHRQKLHNEIHAGIYTLPDITHACYRYAEHGCPEVL